MVNKKRQYYPDGLTVGTLRKYIHDLPESMPITYCDVNDTPLTSLEVSTGYCEECNQPVTVKLVLV